MSFHNASGPFGLGMFCSKIEGIIGGINDEDIR